MFFGGILPLAPQPLPPGGALAGVGGYPKMKIKIIIEIPTIENPELMYHMFLVVYSPAPQGRPCGGWGTLK